jgi:hypothetical protein
MDFKFSNSRLERVSFKFRTCKVKIWKLIFKPAEDLMEDGTISRISNAYSLRRGRRLPPTSEVKELQFVIVIRRRKLNHPTGVEK